MSTRMPDHKISDPPWSSIPSFLQNNACKGGKVSGYALPLPNGRLHCNVCGWVTDQPAVVVGPFEEGEEAFLRVRVARGNPEQALIEIVSMDGPFSLRVPQSELEPRP